MFEEFEKYLDRYQVLELEQFYQNNQKLLSGHVKDFKLLKKHTLMKVINEKNGFRESFHTREALKRVEIDNKEYILITGYKGGIALFDYQINEWHHFYKVGFKSTNIYIWLSMENTYKWIANEYNQFYECFKTLFEKQIEIIQTFPEYKYIKVSELNLFCPYVMLMYRDNKERLWQVEMLQKSGFKRLASELVSRSDILLDFKILRSYPEYFTKRGIGIARYSDLKALHNKGFTDPTFIYVGEGDGWFSRWNSNESWLRLIERSKINRDRFVKYINNRKSTIFGYGIKFLDEYLLYLQYCEKVGLDLSRNKYAFPEDLDKEFESILYLDRDSDELYKDLLFNTQRNISEEKQHVKYKKLLLVQKIENQKIERKREVERKRREKIRNERLAKLWDMTKNFRFDVSENLVIVAPTSSEELFVEGKTLNHCVGNYIDSIADGKRMIYFVRKRDMKINHFIQLKSMMVN